MLFKKKKAPSFQPPRPQPVQTHRLAETEAKEGTQRLQPSVQTNAASLELSKRQLIHLQQFMQQSYQTVTDYEYLLSQTPTEHLASTLRTMIEDEKKHYQTLLHFYRSTTSKEPDIADATLNRNGYIPALKRAFEQEQESGRQLEEAARFAPTSQLKDIYASLARDQQRHALWLLSYLTIFVEKT